MIIYIGYYIIITAHMDDNKVITDVFKCKIDAAQSFKNDNKVISDITDILRIQFFRYIDEINDFNLNNLCVLYLPFESFEKTKEFCDMLEDLHKKSIPLELMISKDNKITIADANTEGIIDIGDAYVFNKFQLIDNADANTEGIIDI
jgi:hypothetical protein